IRALRWERPHASASVGLMSIQRYGKWDFRAVDRASAARARARLREQGAPVEPERAAAVVLLREAPLRVFLLRHTAKEPFGAVVKREGGQLETVRERWAVDAENGAGPQRARTSRYGFPGGRHKPDDPDVAMTGVREVEEETGAMVALQRAWSRWITPEYEPVRFDAWIYVATLAEGFQPRIRVREPEYATWVGPEQAVCQYGGQMSMPEATTLADLSRHSTGRQVFAAAVPPRLTPPSPTPERAAGRLQRLRPLDVGADDAESLRAVQLHRPRVGLVHVEVHLPQPARGQVRQSRQRQRLPQAGALGARVDAQHVDLAGAALDLRPVEAEHALGVLGDDEALRVEPRLAPAVAQVRGRPAALLGVVGEGRGVDPQPLLVVLAGPEGPQGHPLRQVHRGL